MSSVHRDASISPHMPDTGKPVKTCRGSARFNMGVKHRAEAVHQILSSVMNIEGGPRRLVLELNHAIRHGRPRKFKRMMSRIAAGQVADNFAAPYYTPPPIPQTPIDHETYVKYLVSPSLDSNLSHQTMAELLGDPFFDHSGDLDKVRSTSISNRDSAYDLIITGQFRRALYFLKLGRFSGHQADQLITVIRRHLGCFLIRTAHSKVELIKSYEQRPLGAFYAGFADAKAPAHTLMAGFRYPASVIQDIEKSVSAVSSHAILGQQATDICDHCGLTPNNKENTRLLEQLEDLSNSVSDKIDLNMILPAISRSAQPLAELSYDDVKSQLRTDRTFGHIHFGLSATESTSFVARELQLALQHAEQILTAIAAGKAYPKSLATTVPQDRVIKTSVLLRIEGRADRYAGHDLDMTRNSGRAPVRRMEAAIKDRAVYAKLRKILGIDAGHYFKALRSG